MRGLVWIGLLWVSSSLTAQPRNEKGFPDGFYLSGISLADRVPEFTWDQILGDWYLPPESGYLRGRFRLRVSGAEARALVICLDGRGYILDPDEPDTSVLYYAPLVTTGAICLFKVERAYPVQIPVRAYNPVNGHPFMETTVERREESVRWMMWDPATGEQAVLNPENYAIWTGAEVARSVTLSDLIQGIRDFNTLFSRHGRPKTAE